MTSAWRILQVCFNSIKVRLIPNDGNYDVASKGCFNSIKVRLILLKSFSLTHFPQFQFHKGSINTDT